MNDIIAAHETQREQYEGDGVEAGSQWKEKWHDAKEVADKLALAIFAECVHIYQHSVLKDGPASYYRKDTGEVDTKHSLDTVWEDAVCFIRRYLRRWGFCGEGIGRIPDYAFLAIIAIHEAHYVLQRIYEYQESEENVPLVEDVQIAASILLQAERLRTETSTVPIANLKPLAETMKQKIPSLFTANRVEGIKPSKEDNAEKGFKHNSDYTCVSLKGKEYYLPFDKGKLIKVLHEAYKIGGPVLSKQDAMEKAGLKGRFTDLFKTARDVKQALIVEENNGRSCRLNI